MIRFDQDFFDTLAMTGEASVLGIVQTLANTENFNALDEFMTFSSRNAENFPNLYKMKTMPVSCVLADGSTGSLMTNYFAALMTPFAVFKKDRAQWERRHLPEALHHHADAVFAWAAYNPAENNAALLMVSNYLVSNVADVNLLGKMEEFWQKSGSSMPLLGLMETAFRDKNLVAIQRLFDQLSIADVREFMRKTETDFDDDKYAAGGLSAIVIKHPEALEKVLEILENMERKSGIDLVARIRLEMLHKVIGSDSFKPSNPSDLYDVLTRLQGGSEKQTTSQKKWLRTAAEETLGHATDTVNGLVKKVVEKNCLELLELVSPFLDAQRNPRMASIATALEGGFGVVNGAEGARRLRQTIEFLQAHGHTLDSVELDESSFKNNQMHALHFLAQGLATDDIAIPSATSATVAGHSHMEKLAVLLDMGCDPTVKDRHRKMPHHYLHVDAKPLWHHTVNAHKARGVAHDVLAEIDRSPSL